MDKRNAKDMFAFFKEKNPDTDVNYTFYKYVISEFYKKVSQEILNGETFLPGHKLGELRIKQVERDPDKKVIDWGTTNKLAKETGVMKHVYFTDDHWYRWYWKKSNTSLRNKSVYKFSATGGPNGNVKALPKKLKSDPFASLNYKP